MKVKEGTRFKRVQLQDCIDSVGTLIVSEVRSGKVIRADFYNERTPDVRRDLVDPIFKVLKNRKDYRRVKVNDRSAPHGVSSRLVLDVYPDGVINIRESGRRKSYTLTAATLYVLAVRSEVEKVRRAKAAVKKERSLARRK